jgi:hypothetical protein
MKTDNVPMVGEYLDLVVRVALIEEWQRLHPETHRLEGVALAIAKDTTFITRELYDRELQHLRSSIDSLRSSRDSSAGASAGAAATGKTLLDMWWPFVLAVDTFIAGHLVWK